jgi:RNA polymerase sigma-70 factor (ECF subfamily)
MNRRTTDLMARARAGQSDAMGELCALYGNYLRMVARAGLGPWLGRRVELSDVVQETLVEVVRQFPKFTGQDEAALVGWLRRLVGQKLVDLARHHNRVKRGAGILPLSLDAVWDYARGDDRADRTPGSRSDNPLLKALALDQSNPSEVASYRELSVRLADALASLPETEAEVLWLYHAEGLSFEMIGRRLGVSRKVVRTIWARGLKALRRIFNGPPGGPPRFAWPLPPQPLEQPARFEVS